MYDALGKQLGTALFYFVGDSDGYEVSFRGKDVGTLTWNRDEPLPTLEQLQEALWRGSWAEVRKRRNELLDATDWCAHVDSPAMSDEMKTYRQALRDLPASCENSADVVFPTPPE